MEKVECPDEPYVPQCDNGDNENQFLPRTSKLKKGLIVKDFLQTQQAEFEVCPADDDGNEDERYYSSGEEDECLYNPAMTELASTDESGRSLFQRYGDNMEDLTDDGGVKKKMLSKGVGAKVVTGAVVEFHYRSYTEQNHEPIDSSRLRNDCCRLWLNGEGTIKGLQIALLSMNVGETSQFLIRYDYAFGKLGCAPRIPAEATLLYEVEVMSTIDYDAAVHYNRLSSTEQVVVSFEEKRKATKANLDAAKHCFNQKQYSEALKNYKAGIRVMENSHLRNQAEQDESDKLLVQLYLNTAVTYGKMKKDWTKVMTFTRKALEIDRSNVKGMYWRGQAKRHLKDYKGSRRLFVDALKLRPNDPEIKLALQKMDEEQKKMEKEESALYRRMLAADRHHDEEAADADIITDAVAAVDLSGGSEVSDDFKKMLKRQLESFGADRKQKCQSFPSSLTFREIEYLEKECLEFGFVLDRKRDSEGNNEFTIEKPK